MTDLISIVMPVYNAEKYLEQAIQSCLNQTFSNFEFIAVNDGSTDNTVEILNGYSDKLIVISQEHVGVSAALNNGIRKMNNNLFKIMNADDILMPEALELLANKYEKLNNKKTIIHGNWESIDEHGNILNEFKDPDCSKMDLFKQNIILLNHNIVNNMTTILHKDTFTKYGFYNESLRAAIDYELWLRLCLKYEFRLALIDKTIVKYRKHKENITYAAMNETPNYVNDVRNLVLASLEHTQMKKYRVGLKRYQKIQKIKTKAKITFNRLKNKSSSIYKKTQ